jgi:hypothetical protein
MRAMKNASTAALVGIWMILLTAFVVTILYVGRQLLIPLALAAMLTFLLAPLVGYIERWIGRIAAVLIVGVLPRRQRPENHARPAKLTFERRLSLHHDRVDVRGCNWNVRVLKAQRRAKAVGDYRFHNTCA